MDLSFIFVFSGPRTLHDLSCQFGTRGFSKEMRQIAGGSQSGLRKFLQQAKPDSNPAYLHSIFFP
jgi:hypothetical protein